jgi:hypothetical protein
MSRNPQNERGGYLSDPTRELSLFVCLYDIEGAPSTFDGSRKSFVAIICDLGQTCPDENYRRTVHAANRNPVVESTVTSANPISFATIANVCEVGDSMEELPLFPATVPRFRLMGASDESLRLSLEDLLSCPRPG